MNEIIFHIRWSHISKWGWKCVFVLGCHNLWNYVRFRINIIPHPSCHGQRGWGEGLSFGRRGIDCHSIWKIQYSYVTSVVAFTNCHDHQQYCSFRSNCPAPVNQDRTNERVHEHILQRGCWSINGHWTSSSFLISLCWCGTCSSSNNNS